MSPSVDPAAGFSQTYGEARERFLAAAHRRSLPVTHYVHPVARGVQGEELAIDVAVLGRGDASQVLLLTSATHGVEGFCGSGCQLNLLQDDAFVAEVHDADVRVVFLHALNPYGFSHLRRTNEDNVDLNRNFRDFSVPVPSNAAYAEVHGFIVSATWPPAPANEARMADYITARGERALQAAVTGGQCEFPEGLFYGGVRPAWSNTIFRRILREQCAGGTTLRADALRGNSRSGAALRAHALGWIDFHTGLGPRGHGEKIYAGRDVAADIARTKACWGDDVTSFHDGSSTSAPLTGVNYNAVYEECPRAAFAGIALEYGTQPMMAVMGALRADQWLANHPDAPAPLRTAIKRAIRDAFYQDADDWKRTVHAQALAQSRAAVARLATVNV